MCSLNLINKDTQRPTHFCRRHRATDSKGPLFLINHEKHQEIRLKVTSFSLRQVRGIQMWSLLGFLRNKLQCAFMLFASLKPCRY